MGYGFYERDGMNRGYMVPDVCHAPGCTVEIDRGLAYLCYACTKYFCGEHLGYFSEQEFDCFAGKGRQTCTTCAGLLLDELGRGTGPRGSD